MRNAELIFTLDEIVRRCQIRPYAAKRELLKLAEIQLLSKKVTTHKVEGFSVRKKGRKLIRFKVVRKKKVENYSLNPRFYLLSELKDLVLKATTIPKKQLLRDIRALGHVKLAVVSGLLLAKQGKSRTDLLIVGDYIAKKKIEKFLLKIESEIGKAISYTLMETEEFKYRLKMYDRFLRDIFEFPHEKLINRLQNLV